MKKTGELTVATASRGATVVTRVSQMILNLVAVIPASNEAQSVAPDSRAHALARSAARATARVSGAAALAPGPLGLLTLLPDIVAVWKIQSQLVADIAAVYGKTSTLGKEQMLYCLFRHSAAQAFRDVVFRAGERFLVRRASLRVLQKITQAIGIKLSQRAMGQAVSRFLPLVGAAAVAGYGYADTRQVGSAAMELFGTEAVLEEQSESQQPSGLAESE